MFCIYRSHIYTERQSVHTNNTETNLLPSFSPSDISNNSKILVQIFRITTTMCIQSHTRTHMHRHTGFQLLSVMGLSSCPQLSQLSLFYDGQTFLCVNTVISLQSNITAGHMSAEHTSTLPKTASSTHNHLPLVYDQ